MKPEEKRCSYFALSSKTKKELAERSAFLGFIEAAKVKVDPDSAANEEPLLPDISCKIEGAPYFFELGEITDENLAKDISTSLRDGIDGEGGFFSEEQPLIRIVRKKKSKTYQTNGAPMDLVLYYDKQFQIAPAEYLKLYKADIDACVTPDGAFSRIWIYSSWTKSILWQR